MKKFWILLIIAVAGVSAFSLLPTAAEGRASKLKRAQNPIPNRYLVLLDPNVLRAEESSSDLTANRLSRSYGGSVDRVFRHALQGFSAEMSPHEAEAMSNDPRVLFIEEDSEITVEATQANPTWGLDRVDQRTVPLNTAYNYVSTGSGVHVYVIDTGVRPTHVEFGGRATVDYDSIHDGQNGVDCHGHGTHVSGTIAGVNYGVAKNARIHGIRVLACNGTGTVATAVEGIDWVTANHISPAVANMSMGAASSALLDYVVQSSIASGVTYVVAAGNANADACGTSPARVPNAITVGASDMSDTKASFSNFGSCVDLFAPGVSIVSAWSWSNTATNVANGTSMASPHVAGTVALFLETHQNATPAQVTGNLLSESTAGTMNGLDTSTANRMVYTDPQVAPTAGEASIDGRVVSNTGRAIKGVTITLQNASASEFKTAITNAFGFYRFDDLEVGSFYVMSIRNKRYFFENSPYAFTLNDNFTAPAFIGTPQPQ